MSQKRRAQFFSSDFVIAVVALCFAIGVLLHTSQLSLDNLSRYGQHNNNVAEMVAASLATPGTTPIQQSRVPFTCWAYDNGTESAPDCATIIDGPGGCTARDMDVYSTMRLVECSGSACLLTVKSCDVVLQ